jgi:histidinol dehydrogenase
MRHPERGVERVVRAIIAGVRRRGDAAVLAYARRFDASRRARSRSSSSRKRNARP